MQPSKNSTKLATPGKSGFWIALLCLTGVLSILFFRSFLPGIAHFANDGPLGAIKADYMSPWPNFQGIWLDLYWIGMNAGTLSIDLNSLILLVLGPVGDAKFLQPLSLLFLGISAWVFFRQLKLSPGLALVAAFGAALNMNFFSNVCWGLGTRGLTLGWIFLGLAALTNTSPRLRWVKLILGGLAIGMAVIEGADNGAIFSVFVGLFVIYSTLVEEGAGGKALAKGMIRAGVVAVFAGLIAYQTITMLVGTQIQSVAGMQQEQQTSEERWNWATQWSLPKAETLRVLVPGLYGYRMDSPDGGAYWGRVGQTPGYETHRQGIARFSGAGEYAGILVLLVGIWALVETFRSGSSFDPKERRYIWFWGVAALISMLLGWGRFAPFYQAVYALPYFSTIRNPMKFMHPFHMAFMILFAYGLLGLSRRYMESVTKQVSNIDLKGWWARASVAEKRWNYGCIAFVALSIFAFLGYSARKTALQQQLSETGFDPGMSAMIARFSVNEVGLFVLFLILSVGLVMLIMSGTFAGRRARLGVFLLGFLLVVDLSRANSHWIKFYDYRDKYASNPIVDILKEKPYQHRVVLPPLQGGREYAMLQQVYMVEWIQHHFPYYNVQSLDVSQEPRMPADKLAYRTALISSIGRLWQLTNTRYVMGMTGSFVDALNQQLDPGKNRFRVVTPFKFEPKPGVEQLTSLEQLTAITNAEGPYALIEFTGALPRARLYTQWQASTNDQEILKELAKPEFNPEQRVLISGGGSLPPPAAAPASSNASVEFTSYSPKVLKLRSQAESSTVLLLNDKYDPGWKVFVDNKPAELLRANFIMRGVYLPGGTHEIVFRFEPPVKGLFLTLAAIGLGIVLSGVLFIFRYTAPGDRSPASETLSTPQAK